ncbi:MAG: hypothetical protein D6760_05980 [Deltaproteobacteria bacterium]|nr:MAG: hypothetical protein D6760_05980 [Deltaproteobacteria bacterium]
MTGRLTRRRFLQAAGTALGLSLVRLAPLSPVSGPTAAHASPRRRSIFSYRSYEDVYRERWSWDRVVRGSHYSNCGYQRCAWNVYVKDGIVWREEQLGAYPQTNPELPDFNPRGCQKGACYSSRMYDQARLTVPLKRSGRRGEANGSALAGTRPSRTSPIG